MHGQSIKNSVKDKVVSLDDVLTIVGLSFSLGVFSLGDYTFRQVMGSSIGNQISPVLSNVAVSVSELQWQRNWACWWKWHKKYISLHRYVDNRFILHDPRMAQHVPFQELVSLEFYTPPVLLEEVGDLHFLGFEIRPELRQVRYLFPSESWQFRNPHSAGSKQHSLSGFRSRVCLICRYCYPWDLVSPTLYKLLSLYQEQGYCTKLLSPLIRRALHANRRD